MRYATTASERVIHRISARFCTNGMQCSCRSLPAPGSRNSKSLAPTCQIISHQLSCHRLDTNFRSSLMRGQMALDIAPPSDLFISLQKMRASNQPYMIDPVLVLPSPKQPEMMDWAKSNALGRSSSRHSVKETFPSRGTKKKNTFVLNPVLGRPRHRNGMVPASWNIHSISQSADTGKNDLWS